MPFVLVPDREAELKARIEADEARERITSAVLHLAREHTATIDGRLRRAALRQRRLARDRRAAGGAPRRARHGGRARAAERRARADGRGRARDPRRRRPAGGAERHRRRGEGAAVNIWDWVDEAMRELDEQRPRPARGADGPAAERGLEDENDEVEAIVPEALALARSLELPWVEIFIRHWQLQSICGRLRDAAAARSSCSSSATGRARRLPAVGLHGAGRLDRLRRVRRPGLRRGAAGGLRGDAGAHRPLVGLLRLHPAEKVGALNDADRHEDALEVAAGGPRGAGRGGQGPRRLRPPLEHAAAARTPRGGAEGGAARGTTSSENGTFAYAAPAAADAGAAGPGPRVEEAREELLPLEIALQRPEVPRVVGAQHAVARRGG